MAAWCHLLKNYNRLEQTAGDEPAGLLLIRNQPTPFASGYLHKISPLAIVSGDK
jgi:hypothetical protein